MLSVLCNSQLEPWYSPSASTHLSHCCRCKPGRQAWARIRKYIHCPWSLRQSLPTRWFPWCGSASPWQSFAPSCLKSSNEHAGRTIQLDGSSWSKKEESMKHKNTWLRRSRRQDDCRENVVHVTWLLSERRSCRLEYKCRRQWGWD